MSKNLFKIVIQKFESLFGPLWCYNDGFNVNQA